MTAAASPHGEAQEPGAAPSAAPGPTGVGTRILGGVLLAAGVALLVEALREAGEGEFTAEGARWAPVAVTAGWVILALIYLVRMVVVPQRDYPPDSGEAEAAGVHWPTPALVLGLLVVYALLYPVLGFVAATLAFFVSAARVLGSRRLLRDIVIGGALAFGVYLVFTRLLDIQLPSGVLPL